MNLLVYRLGDSLAHATRVTLQGASIEELTGREADIDRLLRGEASHFTVTSEGNLYVVALTQAGIDAFAAAHMVAAVVITRGGKALVLQRGPTAPWMPLAWNLPGGGVDAGELTEDAAIREAVEESGIRLDRRALRYIRTFDGGGWFIDMYTAPTESRALPEAAPRTRREELLPVDPKLGHPESCSYEWVTADEVDALHFVPFVKEAILTALAQTP